MHHVTAALVLLAAIAGFGPGPVAAAADASAPADASAAPVALSAADRAEIEQLYATYNHAIDSGDGAAWADTFTPDGTFGGRYTGREGLMTFISEWTGAMNGAARRHWNSNLVLAATPTGARGSVYLMLVDIAAAPPAIVMTGVYTDALVRTASGWRFKRRDVANDRPPQ